MSNNYTIYAEKPESHGRYDDSFWGDTIFAFELSSDDILDIVVRCLSVNLSLKYLERGYEIVILSDGHPISQDERDAIFAMATPRAQKNNRRFASRGEKTGRRKETQTGRRVREDDALDV